MLYTLRAFGDIELELPFTRSLLRSSSRAYTSRVPPRAARYNVSATRKEEEEEKKEGRERERESLFEETPPRDKANSMKVERNTADTGEELYLSL